VVTAGTQPPAAPPAPTIAAGASVIINVGFNGTNLVLTRAGATQGKCVEAAGPSVIGPGAPSQAGALFQAGHPAVAPRTPRPPARRPRAARCAAPPLPPPATARPA